MKKTKKTTQRKINMTPHQKINYKINGAVKPLATGPSPIIYNGVKLEFDDNFSFLH